MTVRFDGISKVFPDGTVALDALNLAFDTGEFLVLLCKRRVTSSRAKV